MVAWGYIQIEGFDYGEKFTSVVKINRVRMVISLVVKFNWKLFQMDMNNIFLNGTLEEKIYVK